MKFEKHNEFIAATTNLPGINKKSTGYVNGAIVKEVLITLIAVLGIGFWIRSCMTMENPIFFQKAIVCSFIIIALIFFKRISVLR